jgi:hypothetical protein
MRHFSCLQGFDTSDYTTTFAGEIKVMFVLLSYLPCG